MKNQKEAFKIKPLAILLASVLAVFLAACAGQGEVVRPGITPTGTTPESEGTPSAGLPGGEVVGAVELVEALKAAGATVETVGEVSQDFIPVAGQAIQVNGVDVQVFEFDSEEERQAVSDTISPDGSTIGTTMVTWVEPPHFWAQGRLLVLYLGSDVTVVELFTSILGQPIAGAE